ncbi:MAG: hypothetical protein ACXV5Q_05925, partial [Frankiaceae bacterium]
RRGAEWVGEQLSLTREDDSFEVTMRRDRELSAEALRRADDDEREWQKAKARENATADESIASIIGRLVETGTFRNVDNAPETRTPRNIGSAETRTSGNKNLYFQEQSCIQKRGVPSTLTVDIYSRDSPAARLLFPRGA